MKQVAKENLLQLKELLQNIDQPAYNATPKVLSGSSVGQHMRHVLEFYLLLVSGSFSGTISYDKRQRDKRIESDVDFALKTVEHLLAGIDTLDVDMDVKFDADYSVAGQGDKHLNSSVGRELAYCIEHSIHHQALIKAGLIALGLSNLTNNNFGVAYSTIRYRNKPCAQ
jgi:uncharacterized damage-inducible protein DinB